MTDSRQPVALVKPAKPLNQMTEAEFEAWVDSMWGTIKARLTTPTRHHD